MRFILYIDSEVANTNATLSEVYSSIDKNRTVVAYEKSTQRVVARWYSYDILSGGAWYEILRPDILFQATIDEAEEHGLFDDLEKK